MDCCFSCKCENHTLVRHIMYKTRRGNLFAVNSPLFLPKELYCADCGVSHKKSKPLMLMHHLKIYIAELLCDSCAKNFYFRDLDKLHK